MSTKKLTNSQKLDAIMMLLEKRTGDMQEAIDLLSKAMQYVCNSSLSRSIELTMEIKDFLRRQDEHHQQ